MPTVRTNDLTTYYEDRSEGQPIVFVHGAILDHYSQWAPQLNALTDDYRCLAYDVRGHGRTGGSTRDDYTIELLADDLAAFLDALDLEDPVICGLSTGGCIAQVFAARHPDRLSGLVLAGTFGPPYLTFGDRLQRRHVLPATILPVRLFGYERVERALVWLNETLGESGGSGDYEKVESLRETAPTMSTTEFAKTIRAIAGFHHATIEYDAISVPTLVLYGEHEPGFIRAHATRFGDVLPNSTVRTIPGAGHASNLDNPDCFTTALRDFATSCQDDERPRRGDDPVDRFTE